MRKFIFFTSLLFTFSSLNASYLLGHLERCAEDYYYSYSSSAGKYYLYYLNSVTGNWNKTTTNVGFIDSGYIYDSNTSKCIKDPSLLGLDKEQFEYLNGFLALFVAFILLWSLI
jgi:hypothetical protein